jgi:osmoprotectant transport system ATP-binding protein
VITFSDVSKVYPDGTTAVDGLSLEIPTGRITVFVGPSGCGKTTSLRMINRMVEPTDGTVAIDGVDNRSVDAPKLRRGIGYVIQNAGLFPHRTIVDNVTTVPVLQGSSRRAARSAGLALLERVGLGAELADRYPAQLSGGQQQRVGVARALAADPPVMLMDEPFSAVDPVVRHQLQDEFLRLQDELGKTIVFVTHDIDEAIQLGDRIAVFAVGGRLAQYDSPVELLHRPADDFVADFVGRDRGFRALGFTRAGRLPVRQEPTGILGAPLPDGDPGWVLVVDDQRRPRGWVDRAAITDRRPIVTTDLRLGGALVSPGSSMRTALDSALSSPSGRGVVVDSDGRLVGTVTATEVLEQGGESANGGGATGPGSNEARG